MSFMPTNTYAEIQPFETGLNINSYLLKYITKDCDVWHISVVSKYGLSHITVIQYLSIITYHAMRTGAAFYSQRKFTHNINDGE